ncbi:alpha/beta hydrolase [Paenibacillus sp. CC-CFT747]|nr:alpha/beta hydrolase [Paenibacillus sp. CC-CFT747]
MRRRSAGVWRGRLVRITLVLAVLLTLCAAGLSTYVGWSLTHPAKKPLTEMPSDYGLSYEKISFPSRDGKISLKGWFLPGAEGTGGKTVIIAHGYSKNRLQDDAHIMPLVQSIIKEGYGVVMFDFRNSGESGGSLTSVGEYEEQDLLGAIDWVKQEHPGRTALLGFSMGASTALMAAAEEPSVASVIADSPFSHLERYLKENLPAWSHLPSFPFTPLILGILPRWWAFTRGSWTFRRQRTPFIRVPFCSSTARMTTRFRRSTANRCGRLIPTSSNSGKRSRRDMSARTSFFPRPIRRRCCNFWQGTCEDFLQNHRNSS